MCKRRIQTISVLAIACIIGALVFALAPARVEAQSGDMQWVPFTVGRTDGDNSAVYIYMTNGSFVVSNSPDAQTREINVYDAAIDSHHNEQLVTAVFGTSSQNDAESAQSWSGDLPPGTYFIGIYGDLSTLSITGEAVSYKMPVVSYTPPAVSAPAAVTVPTQVTQPAAMPATTSQAQVNPSNQMQWFVVTVGALQGEDVGELSIYMTGGTFFIANTPNPLPADLSNQDPAAHPSPPSDTIAFGTSSEDIDGVGQSWSGHQVPGTYYVCVQGNTSTLHVWGDAVTYAPMPNAW